MTNHRSKCWQFSHPWQLVFTIYQTICRRDESFYLSDLRLQLQSKQGKDNCNLDYMEFSSFAWNLIVCICFILGCNSFRPKLFSFIQKLEAWRHHFIQFDCCFQSFLPEKVNSCETRFNTYLMSLLACKVGGVLQGMEVISLSNFFHL